MTLPAHTRALALLAASLVMSVGAGEASAATKIKRANAVDADRDGSVDGFDVTFSAKLRGKARTGSKVPFKVKGYRVTGMRKPSGRRVRVRVAEGSACDLGAKPRIAFRGGRLLTDSRKRRLRRSRIDLARKDRRAPRLTCAVTADRDDDGHIDAITLTYSRAVRSPAGAGSGPFGVDRYSVASRAAANGRYVTLRLREKASFDTGAVPAILYRRPKQKALGVRATARRRGAAASTTFNDTRDKARARLVSARTEDASGDGRVDGVVARFSEAVKADPAALAVAGARISSVGARGRDGLVARVAEGPLRGDARPQVSFGTAGKPLRDLAGNAAPRTSVKADDGAAPVIVAARTLDRAGAASRLDTLALTWSERVSHAADADGSYPFGVTGYSMKSAGAASGTALDLSLNEGDAPDSGARPPVGYTRGAGAPVRDAAGNEAPSHVYAGASDGIAPRLLGTLTVDADFDGKLDGVRFEFTESVSSTLRNCPGCAFSASGLTAVRSQAAAGSAVTLDVTETGLNGGVRPTASYAGDGSVRDASGNVAPAGSSFSADGAPPVAIDAFTEDTDANKKIDRVRVRYSEPLDFAGDSSAPISFTASGYTVASVSAAADDTISVNLVESGSPDTGSAPAIGYDGDGQPLRDVNGVEHATRTWQGLTRDAVAPSFVEARTADLNSDPTDEVGKVDAVELVYSEEVAGTPDISDFTVTGRTIEQIAFSPESLQVEVAEAGSYDTDATLPVAYSPGDIHDLAEGPGDTTDAAPAANTTAADGAPPAIVAAQTADTTGPNGKVDHVGVTLSETVTVATGSTPAIELSNPTLAVVDLAPTTPSTQFTATVVEAGAPNGGAKPEITVPDPVRVKDGAGNEVRPEAFAATTDNVAPVLLRAKLGEQSGGACGTGAVDGSVDCVRATWSEEVTQPASFSGLSLASPFTVDSLLSAPAGPDVDVGFAEVGGANRDSSTTLTYTGGGAGDVADLAGIPSFSPASIPVGAACLDISHEPNDVRDLTNPLLSANSVEKLCAGDEDWFRINPTAGRLHVRVDPHASIGTSVQLFDSAGTLVDTAPANGLGSFDVVSEDPATGVHYLRVTAPAPQEGQYCIDVDHNPGDPECDDGDSVPQ